jgi:hypothetical protein
MSSPFFMLPNCGGFMCRTSVVSAQNAAHKYATSTEVFFYEDADQVFTIFCAHLFFHGIEPAFNSAWSYLLRSACSRVKLINPE